MKMTKKVYSILLISILVANSVVAFDEAKHKKHLMVGAYSIVGLYSIKKVLESIVTAGALIFVQRAMHRFPLEATNIDRIRPFLLVHLYNIAKLSIFGSLGFFSIKNLIEILCDQNKEEKAEPEVVSEEESILQE